jgi:hypothetical protein
MYHKGVLPTTGGVAVIGSLAGVMTAFGYAVAAVTLVFAALAAGRLLPRLRHARH